MAWTFGGATNNRITVTAPVGAGTTATTALVCGWWYPTTLTSGRAYWSSSTIISARVSPATSEITLHTDNTTDGLWTTSGAAIAVNEWYFIAFMVSCLNTAPVSGAWRVWIGDTTNAPREVAVSVTTTPVGNFTAGANFIIGQLGSTGTVAFQGDIGDCMYLTQASTLSTTGPLATAAYGAITQAEADNVRLRLVCPAWLGNRFPDNAWYISGGGTNPHVCISAPLDLSPALSQLVTANAKLTTQIGQEPWGQNSTAGAIVKSAARCPRGTSAILNVTRDFRRR